MTARALSFVRWASVGQAALAVYLIGASFVRAGLQGRHREAYSMFASRETNDVVIAIAQEATKASEWAESAAWHTMLAGVIVLVLAIAQLKLVSTRPPRTQTPG